MKAMRPSRRAQRGQNMIIGAVLALVIFALILARWATVQRTNYVQDFANAQGANLAQFGIGVRGYIAAVQGGTATLTSNPYIVTGVNFLKPPTCGGLATNPTAGYVPCSYDGGTYGTALSTTITETPATKVITSSTTFVVEPENGGQKVSASDLASKIVSATLANQASPQNGLFINAFANAPATATSQPNPNAIVAANYGRVVLYASNAPTNDIWLRVDGTNQMLADLNMGGNSIDNALNGSFTGSVRVQGTAEVDNGLSVTAGTADLRGGTITPDVEVTSVGHMASQALYNMQVLTGATSYTVAQPNCSAANEGTSAPSIYVAMQGSGTPESVSGDALYEAHANVVNNGSTWTVTPVAHATTFSLTGSSSGGNLTLNLNKTVSAEDPSDQVLLVMTKCK